MTPSAHGAHRSTRIEYETRPYRCLACREMFDSRGELLESGRWTVIDHRCPRCCQNAERACAGCDDHTYPSGVEHGTSSAVRRAVDADSPGFGWGGMRRRQR